MTPVFKYYLKFLKESSVYVLGRFPIWDYTWFLKKKIFVDGVPTTYLSRAAFRTFSWEYFRGFSDFCRFFLLNLHIFHIICHYLQQTERILFCFC